MRGFPPIQIVLLVLTFILLAIPLSHLTGNAQARPVEKMEKTRDHAVKSLLRLRYAHKPATLSLQIGGQTLIATMDDSPIEIKTPLEGLHRGIDVFLTATWPESTPDTAITIDIEPDGLDTQSQTRWSSASSLDEPITFTWK